MSDVQVTGAHREARRVWGRSGCFHAKGRMRLYQLPHETGPSVCLDCLDELFARCEAAEARVRELEAGEEHAALTAELTLAQQHVVNAELSRDAALSERDEARAELAQRTAERDEWEQRWTRMYEQERGLRAEVEALREIDVVFDGPPGPEAGRFVEVETAERKSIRVGEWIERDDGYWVLRLKALAATAPTKGS